MVAVLAFALLTAIAIYKSIDTPDGEKPDLEEQWTYVSATLSTIVGGVVAASFGLAPNEPTPSAKGRGAQSPKEESADAILMASNLEALSSVVTGKKTTEVDGIIGGCYAVTYILAGLASITAWLILQDQTADPVKALASTSLGMMVGIVRGYWTQADSKLSH